MSEQGLPVKRTHLRLFVLQNYRRWRQGGDLLRGKCGLLRDGHAHNAAGRRVLGHRVSVDDLACAQTIETGFFQPRWNHPGFWGSTGSPLPTQDAHAADAVMQLVLRRLGFPPGKVIVYGWSIGGFTASWLAMNYPSEVAGLVLDATFDRLTPLAVPRMPACLEKVNLAHL